MSMNAYTQMMKIADKHAKRAKLKHSDTCRYCNGFTGFEDEKTPACKPRQTFGEGWKPNG